MSKLKVNEIDSKTGTTVTVTAGKTLDVPATSTLTVAGTQTVTGTVNLTSSTLTLPATLPATAGTNLTNIPGANITGTIPSAALSNVDTSGLKDDIALLAFKTQANGSLARYNLVDQSVDSFEDASGVDAGASTDENRSANNYYFGGTAGSAATVSFTTPGATTWVAPNGLSTLTHVLVQAGGGGGGGAYNAYTAGGGGGGGGTVYQANRAVVGGTTYNLTVGTSGAGGVGGGAAGTNGGDSIFDTITANGGGGGSAHGGKGAAGGNGGGGARADAPNRPGNAGNQADSGGGTGYNASYGGNGQPYANNSNNAAGGGAGSGGGGANSNGGTGGGAGGVGRDWSSQFSTSIGESGWFGGGGGGGAEGLPSAAGGNGGGGTGGSGPTGNGVAGDVNTGGGGGGAVAGGGSTPISSTGGAGGAGAVHIKHDAYTAEGGDMTLVSNAQTASAAPTKGDLVMTISNAAGTTTVNTDVKAYISRNGSAYTNAVTLVSKGTTAGHTILTANDVDLSGITTGTSMRWKIETLNQSASKMTRIQAVSLGWS